MLACIPAGGFLVWKNRRDPAKRVGMTIFWITLIVCFGASGFFHAAAAGPLRDALHTLDYIGIYLLIAGSGTPIAPRRPARLVAARLLVQLWRWPRPGPSCG